MKIGINITSNQSLDLAKTLIDKRAIDFCEILIDNFIVYDPSMIFDHIGGVPTAIHIMNSRFMERSFKELKELSCLIKDWINALNPIYVSDHIAKFSINGRSLALLGEVNYEYEYDKVKEDIKEWQSILQTKVYFENFPSVLDCGAKQINFLTSLKSDALCGILFDFSNSVIASKNGNYELKKWFDIAVSSEYYHIAGYRKSETKPTILIDSHDCGISNESISFFSECIKKSKISSNKTIVIERDNEIEINSCLSDIKKIRKEVKEMEEKCLN